MPYCHAYALLRGLSLGLCLPIHELFLCENGCPMLHIGLLGTVAESCKLVCELPTGKITAAYGARYSLIWASVLAAICWTGYFVSSGQLVFYYACAVLMGASEAFLTGSMETYIIQQVPPIHATRTMLTNSRIIIAACVLSGAGSGWLYKQGVASYFACIIFVHILSALLPLVGKSHHPAMMHMRAKLGNQVPIFTSVRYICTQKLLMRIVVTSFFVTMACDMVMRYYQPLLLDRAIDITYSGVVFTMAAIVAWFAIGLISRYKNKILHYPFVVLGGLDALGTGICILLATRGGHWSTVTLLAVLLSIEDIRSPLMKSLVLQHNTRVAHTAIILSVCATVESAAEILAGAILGWVVEAKGLNTGFLVSAMLFSCAAGIGLFSFNHRSS
jgi:hypothetical protein